MALNNETPPQTNATGLQNCVRFAGRNTTGDTKTPPSFQAAICKPVILSEDWRVAFDPLQWVLEKRLGRRWRGKSFCVTKAALLRCIREACPEVDIAEVLNFPDWHPDRVAAEAKAPALTRHRPPPLRRCGLY